MSAADDRAEVWLPIPGWEDFYEVSDLGRVRSLTRVVQRSNGTSRVQRGRILKQRIQHTRGGYPAVSLNRASEAHHYRVHTLVLLAFAGQPAADEEACHYNGNPADNRLENLRWANHSQNMLDQVRHGRHRWARRDRCEHGHELTESSWASWRDCLECHRIRSREYRARKRLELAGGTS